MSRQTAAGRFADQLAQRSIAAVGTPLLQGKIGRRAPRLGQGEGHRAWRAPSAEQPHDNAAGDKRGDCSEHELGPENGLRH